ncbi:uncharacterized protein SCHCODRAFT_01137205 [Schizophyllum commune H4-8]|uniref:Expressed protein n=1 Tax=Schizophyllum commune (strain H4-8 / FGSC 9210) TaxID=578458 RepID=D8QKI2_SCHCM|nr:uncharacterized protein SCHCODRAFT_01137205 [Schizophyllum commune H4-8]KAI5885121.1 hypothetical protein SCHCODRAFT_01137205 [Schizophyllum commune H4-8]
MPLHLLAEGHGAVHRGTLQVHGATATEVTVRGGKMITATATDRRMTAVMAASVMIGLAVLVRPHGGVTTRRDEEIIRPEGGALHHAGASLRRGGETTRPGDEIVHRGGMTTGMVIAGPRSGGARGRQSPIVRRSDVVLIDVFGYSMLSSVLGLPRRNGLSDRVAPPKSTLRNFGLVLNFNALRHALSTRRVSSPVKGWCVSPRSRGRYLSHA